MWPILFDWGPVTLHTYGALVALGFFFGAMVTASLAGRRGIPRETVLDLVWVAAVSGLAGARAFYVLLQWDYFAHQPLEILKIWQGGLVWYGGVLAAVPALLFWLKKKNLPAPLMADLLAPGVALGHAVGRLGCFAAGCCFGRVCDLPWAVVFTHPDSLAPRGLPLHPSQLYEAVLNGLVFTLLLFLARRPSWPGRGRLAALYVLFYGVIRLLVEHGRGDDRGALVGPLTPTQWVAVVTALAGLVYLVYSWTRGTAAHAPVRSTTDLRNNGDGDARPAGRGRGRRG